MIVLRFFSPLLCRPTVLTSSVVRLSYTCMSYNKLGFVLHSAIRCKWNVFVAFYLHISTVASIPFYARQQELL